MSSGTGISIYISRIPRSHQPIRDALSIVPACKSHDYGRLKRLLVFTTNTVALSGHDEREQRSVTDENQSNKRSYGG